MPRRNKGRTALAEMHLATRVGLERTRRGWTYEGLAKRMVDVGCAIQPSALYKIEKSEPPRRITVDELVAFSLVFGLTTSELLADPALLLPGEAARLLERATLLFIAFDAASEFAAEAQADAIRAQEELLLFLTDHDLSVEKVMPLVRRDELLKYDPKILATVLARVSERALDEEAEA